LSVITQFEYLANWYKYIKNAS